MEKMWLWSVLLRVSEHLGIAEEISGFVSWVGDGWTEVSAMAHRRKMARLRGPQNQEEAGESLCMGCCGS